MVHKGQLISIGLFVCSNSLEMNEKFLPQWAMAKINNFKFVFWEN